MPTEGTPWQKFMVEPPPNWQVFIQPSGMAPNAENLNYLLQTEETIKLPINHSSRLAQGRRYYERFIEMYGSEDHPWIKRYVYAEYGEDPSGEAVFRATFNRGFHVRGDRDRPGYTLILAQDFGAIHGHWSVRSTIWADCWCTRKFRPPTSGWKSTSRSMLRPRLYGGKYIGSKVVVVGDPSGVAKGTIAEESCFDAFKRWASRRSRRRPTTSTSDCGRSRRCSAGRSMGGPALVINRRQGCPFLVRAMAGSYRYKKHPAGGLRAIPEKFDAEGASHVADCLQYAALIVSGGLVQEFGRRLIPRTRKQERPRVSAAGWT